jgi:leader peptidase (prepilin peptidase)/N-methyltransferase
MALAFLTWALSARTGRPVVLPDRITLPLLLLAWILAPYLGADLLSTLKGSFLAAGGLALAGGLYWAFKPQGETEEEPIAMGYGDVKLLGALGAWLGLYSLLALFLGVLFGALVGLAFRQRKIPFGPYLALGGIVAFFYGEALWRAYLAWLGL